MDPHGAGMMNDGAGVYNFAEIWPAFQLSGGYRMDPMVMDDNGPPDNQNLRRRRDESSGECGKGRHGGASTSNSNGIGINHNAMVESDGKKLKSLESNDNKLEGDTNSGKPAAARTTAKPSEPPPKQDYIHVRARRGQATDSHSLAERARREKISERMRILQDLVPGCNKVIGKALVLDEIINYIQSLQRQVEFLSMKLEAVNSRVGLDGYPSKDAHFTQQTFENSGIAYSQNSREYGRGSSPEWLHMQIGGGFQRTS